MTTLRNAALIVTLPTLAQAELSRVARQCGVEPSWLYSELLAALGLNPRLLDVVLSAIGDPAGQGRADQSYRQSRAREEAVLDPGSKSEDQGAQSDAGDPSTAPPDPRSALPSDPSHSSYSSRPRTARSASHGGDTSGGAAPTAPSAPLVLLGPGGDYLHPWPEEPQITHPSHSSRAEATHA